MPLRNPLDLGHGDGGNAGDAPPHKPQTRHYPLQLNHKRRLKTERAVIGVGSGTRKATGMWRYRLGMSETRWRARNNGWLRNGVAQKECEAASVVRMSRLGLQVLTYLGRFIGERGRGWKVDEGTHIGSFVCLSLSFFFPLDYPTSSFRRGFRLAVQKLCFLPIIGGGGGMMGGMEWLRICRQRWCESRGSLRNWKDGM
jgi:hypothetical protein